MASATATPTATSSTTLEPNLSDPWTPDQELTLLKALVKFKPVGLHAHFRMLSIHSYLLASGTCNANDTHTRIPGIWAKLRTLYDLEKLDEREDTVMESGWRDFELQGEFEGLMWERRLAPEGTPEGSPPWDMGRECTVLGTDEPRSSPVPVRGTRSGRRGGRVSRLKAEGEAEMVEGGRGNSRRRASKAASVQDEDGDEHMEDAEDDEDDEEDGSGEGDEDDGEESEEPDEEEKRGRSSGRGKGGRRGRGRRGRRRG